MFRDVVLGTVGLIGIFKPIALLLLVVLIIGAF